MVNKVTLIGNLGADPEIRHLENGASVAQFSVATAENYKDNMGNWQSKTEWHRVVAWRALADKAQSSLKKGSLVYVEGKISTRKWQDQNGNDRYNTDVVANYFRVLNSRDGMGGGAGNNFPTAADEPAFAPTNTDNGSSTTPTTASESQVADAMDDDLPF
ncbi:MAG: single-stranded DNA-binding protein [Bacteroidota bacterium]